MIAACNGIDVSAHAYDENVLVSQLSESIRQQQSTVVDSIALNEPFVKKVVRMLKLWCICQRDFEFGSMVECEHCLSWFHIKCVDRQNPVRIESRWFCAGCTSRGRQ